jgi:hypothetical protein
MKEVVGTKWFLTDETTAEPHLFKPERLPTVPNPLLQGKNGADNTNWERTSALNLKMYFIL